MFHVVDSRAVIRPSETVFYALKGMNHDGHDYVTQLYSRGVRNFVLSSRRPGFDRLYGASVKYVEDTLRALQEDAAEYRASLHGTEVVGITGSNGKTVVKEWIAQLAGGDVPLDRSPRSYNSQVGVPLSIFEISGDCKIALIEAGMSMPGEMGRLERIIRPDVGIFTHFGQAHGENFASDDDRLLEKLHLFSGSSVLICREGRVADMAARVMRPEARILSWGFSENAAFRIMMTESGINSRKVRFLPSEMVPGAWEMEIPFPDEASFENCMSAVSYLLWKGWAHETIAARVRNLQPVAMRMEVRPGVDGSTLIKDYYNSDPASFAIAVNFLSMQKPEGGKAVILSDFVDAGGRDAEIYREVADRLKEAGVSLFIGIGPRLSECRGMFDLPQARFYSDTEAFVASEKRSSFSNMAVLIKGARKYRFEYIGNFLAKQSHTTVLEVDLNALSENMNIYRRKLPAGTKLAVMVKAFGYGSGSAEVAAQLQYSGADYLMVAYSDEGVALRARGITMPIAVMNPEPESFAQMIEFGLEPEIYSLDLLRGFGSIIAIHGIEGYPVHLKLNTGMNRSGLDMKDIPLLLEFMDGRKTILLKSAFTHLAVADDPAEDSFTVGQIRQFNAMMEMISPHFPYRIARHVLNSAGIERFPEYAFEMARLGIGLYGIGGLDGLQPVSTFKTHIASVREVDSESTVGYGRKGRLSRTSRIAVIPVGYADGLNRHLSCGTGEMYVHGKRVPIVGNICMDACMLDITDTDAGVGDEVEIFGRNIPVTELADKLGTIPYEILTGVSHRVRRVYFKE